MPSGNRSDKHIERSYAERIDMLHALTADVVHRTVTIQIETMELDRDEPTETFDTVQSLHAKYEDKEFTWVFGSDSIATMREWNGGEWLFDNLKMFVVERPGTPIVELGRHAQILTVELEPTSSTEVRERMEADEPIDHLVPPSVFALLAK